MKSGPSVKKKNLLYNFLAERKNFSDKLLKKSFIFLLRKGFFSNELEKATVFLTFVSNEFFNKNDSVYTTRKIFFKKHMKTNSFITERKIF